MGFFRTNKHRQAAKAAKHALEVKAAHVALAGWVVDAVTIGYAKDTRWSVRDREGAFHGFNNDFEKALDYCMGVTNGTVQPYSTTTLRWSAPPMSNSMAQLQAQSRMLRPGNKVTPQIIEMWKDSK